MHRTPPGPDPAGAAPADDPCAPQRRVAEEACALADRLRTMLATARDDLRAAQAALAAYEERRDRAVHDADPHVVQRRKAEAFDAFRLARSRARARADLETAATAWLVEIDDVNRRLVAARRTLETERPEAGPLVAEIERRTVAVDRARVAAEQAAAACRDARAHLAACEEVGGDVAGPAAAVAGSVAATGSVGWPGGARPEAEPAGPVAPAMAPAPAPPTAVPAIHAERPRIVALLHGDARERDVVAVALAGGDPATADRWADLLDDLVAAIIDRALEDSRFVFPRQHAFWGLFRDDECRGIAVALAELGFHPIPGVGWADGRVPGRRDLSLAVGYAGEDPLRIRIWPTEAEMEHLFDDATADVVGHLFEMAGDLTLGEMVAFLGRRAEQLAPLWNAWGRARPLLLAETA
jgi:hypothetical protein